MGLLKEKGELIDMFRSEDCECVFVITCYTATSSLLYRLRSERQLYHPNKVEPLDLDMKSLDLVQSKGQMTVCWEFDEWPQFT
ncbi:hypothetical protein TNCV_4991441 [Trichonephila clavipes]|nr:hypothetical protein TNCV_4991441 [Trichonephila clavipes]